MEIKKNLVKNKKYLLYKITKGIGRQGRNQIWKCNENHKRRKSTKKETN